MKDHIKSCQSNNKVNPLDEVGESKQVINLN